MHSRCGVQSWACHLNIKVKLRMCLCLCLCLLYTPAPTPAPAPAPALDLALALIFAPALALALTFASAPAFALIFAPALALVRVQKCRLALSSRHRHHSHSITSITSPNTIGNLVPFTANRTMTDPIIQVAETVQTASINRHPSAPHDINPSTTASSKEPVELVSSPDSSDIVSDVDEDEIPVSVLRSTPRRAHLPPLPDLRFEQSYLASIQQAESWQKIAWITFRDQVFMPLAQGVVWTLVLSGWRYWNRTAHFTGQSVGARIRRWYEGPRRCCPYPKHMLIVLASGGGRPTIGPFLVPCVTRDWPQM